MVRFKGYGGNYSVSLRLNRQIPKELIVNNYKGVEGDWKLIEQGMKINSRPVDTVRWTCKIRQREDQSFSIIIRIGNILTGSIYTNRNDGLSAILTNSTGLQVNQDLEIIEGALNHIFEGEAEVRLDSRHGYILFRNRHSEAKLMKMNPVTKIDFIK